MATKCFRGSWLQVKLWDLLYSLAADVIAITHS